MRKIYEEPEIDIEKFQFEQVLGVSQDDPNPSNFETDPEWPDDDDPWG